MANQEFAVLHTGSDKSVSGLLHTGSDKSVSGLHYFRKSAVNYFGIAEHRRGQDDHYFRAKITYATSDSTDDTFMLDMKNDIAFKEFVDQMLDKPYVSTEEFDRIRDRLHHTDTPEEPTEEPAFVSRDRLEITEGADKFFKWLHEKYYNTEKHGNWHFKAVPGTNAEDFIVCHKVNTVTSPADVHISFRNQHESARVTGIVIMDHYTPDTPGFNLILHEFVRDIVRPYADKYKITYSYSGTPNEQPTESNGIATETHGKSGMLASLVIPDHAEGFHDALVTKAHHYDIGARWSVAYRDTQFDCRCNDLDTKEHFTVTISFTTDSSYARVTEIQADDKSINADKYNHYLCRFVNEIVKPFAEIQHFKYDYFMDSGKC